MLKKEQELSVHRRRLRRSIPLYKNKERDKLEVERSTVIEEGRSIKHLSIKKPR